MSDDLAVAILCSGESLTLFDTADTVAYSKVIAVNDAAEYVACDVWVALDTVALRRTAPLGTPAVITRRNIYAALCRELPRIRELELIPHRFDKAPMSYRTFSSTTALAYAGYVLGAKRIDCYGIAWDGDRNWKGEASGGRTADRWVREAGIWDGLTRDLVKNGATITRVTREEPVEQMEV